jgi:hypothetical protein
LKIEEAIRRRRKREFMVYETEKHGLCGFGFGRIKKFG